MIPGLDSPSSSSESSARPQPQQGMVSGVLDRFKDEIALIKGAAVEGGDKHTT